MFYIGCILVINKLHVIGSNIVVNYFYSSWKDYLNIFDITMLWYAIDFISHVKLNIITWQISSR
jgi:hypothetical protein